MKPRGPVQVRLCGGAVVERWICECGRALPDCIKRCPRCGAPVEWDEKRADKTAGRQGAEGVGV